MSEGVYWPMVGFRDINPGVGIQRITIGPIVNEPSLSPLDPVFHLRTKIPSIKQLIEFRTPFSWSYEGVATVVLQLIWHVPCPQSRLAKMEDTVPKKNTMCCHFFHPFKLSYIRCKSHMFETALMWCGNMWELETPAHGHSSRPQSCWSHINLTPQIFRGCPLLWILWIVVPLPSTVNQNWGHSWNLCSK